MSPVQNIVYLAMQVSTSVFSSYLFWLMSNLYSLSMNFLEIVITKGFFNLEIRNSRFTLKKLSFSGSRFSRFFSVFSKKSRPRNIFLERFSRSNSSCCDKWLWKLGGSLDFHGLFFYPRSWFTEPKNLVY